MAEITNLEDLVHGPVRIVCEGNSAKNHPAEIGPPKYSHIVFNDRPAGPFEMWEIKKVDGGYSFRNIGTHYWARAFGEVNGSPDWDPEGCTFSIENAGNNTFRVHYPNKDEVWTVLEKERNEGFPKTLFLHAAEGKPNQIFSFDRIERAE